MLKETFGRPIKNSLKCFPEKARTLIQNLLHEKDFQKHEDCIVEYLLLLGKERGHWKHEVKFVTAELAERLRGEGWRRIRESWQTHDAAVKELLAEQGVFFRTVAFRLDEIAISNTPKNGRQKT